MKGFIYIGKLFIILSFIFSCNAIILANSTAASTISPNSTHSAIVKSGHEMSHHPSAVITEQTQTNMTPWQIEQMLKKGNERFANDTRVNRNLGAQAKLTSKKQFPVAVVLSCMDSRGSPELIFDQGIGDIFSIRVAGNILNNDIIGSLEYATQVAGSKLIIIMGHTNCGAMTGACKEVKLGYLTGLLAKIHPAVAAIERKNNSQNCQDPHLIDDIAKKNVHLVMEEIKTKSQIISQLIIDDKVGIVAAMHNLKSGKVIFFEEDQHWLPGMPEAKASKNTAF